MGSWTHCPSCGAPAEGQFCSYCGTPLFTAGDMVSGARGRRCHIWYENPDGTICCFDMLVHTIDVDTSTDTLYCDGSPYLSITTQRNVEISAELLDFDRDDWKKVIEWQQHRMSSRTPQATSA